ncbi:MAG: hypothetical protein HUU22_01600 [Phycisphaerae bacterium]|nr:hypothetical protein [Phycisphaerae bacterium]NUQ44711.1 hypothetical protein [Phycisphaerae bacterium]
MNATRFEELKQKAAAEYEAAVRRAKQEYASRLRAIEWMREIDSSTDGTHAVGPSLIPDSTTFAEIPAVVAQALTAFKPGTVLTARLVREQIERLLPTHDVKKSAVLSALKEFAAQGQYVEVFKVGAGRRPTEFRRRSDGK